MTKWEILVGEIEVITRNRLSNWLFRHLVIWLFGMGGRGELGWGKSIRVTVITVNKRVKVGERLGKKFRAEGRVRIVLIV